MYMDTDIPIKWYFISVSTLKWYEEQEYLDYYYYSGKPGVSQDRVTSQIRLKLWFV